MSVTNETGIPGKKPYRSPSLTVYGSVKELTGNKSGTNTGDTMNMMSSDSDPAVKENIVRVGEHTAGFGMPEAVSIGDQGYRTVNYALL
jgi:hypothetical protein